MMYYQLITRYFYYGAILNVGDDYLSNLTVNLSTTLEGVKFGPVPNSSKSSPF